MSSGVIGGLIGWAVGAPLAWNSWRIRDYFVGKCERRKVRKEAQQ